MDLGEKLRARKRAEHVGGVAPWRKGTKPVARWKKSGNRCPHCNQETEVLAGTVGDYAGVCSAERCWRCGWVSEFDKEKEVKRSEDSRSVRRTRTSRGVHLEETHKNRGKRGTSDNK
jgi:hypothetical protein